MRPSPEYSVEFAPAALRSIHALDPHIRRKAVADIEKLRFNPRPRGAERLETPEKLFRIPVGPGKNYRAIFEIHDGALYILVVKVGDRKDVYRRLS